MEKKFRKFLSYLRKNEFKLIFLFQVPMFSYYTETSLDLLEQILISFFHLNYFLFLSKKGLHFFYLVFIFGIE